MPRFSAREIGHIETSYTSALGRLSWTWVVRADGTVTYRLSQVDRPAGAQRLATGVPVNRHRTPVHRHRHRPGQ